MVLTFVQEVVASLDLTKSNVKCFLTGEKQIFIEINGNSFQSVSIKPFEHEIGKTSFNLRNPQLLKNQMEIFIETHFLDSKYIFLETHTS